MRKRRNFLSRQAAIALAVGCALLPLPPLALHAQENAKQDEPQGRTHTGQVASVDEGRLVMTIDGTNRHTHQVPENARVTLNGEEASLQDLREGDRIEVTTEANNSEVALAIRATRAQSENEDGAQQTDSTRRSGEQRDRQADGEQRRDREGEGRAWLGVLLIPDEQEGARVVQVYPGSPAARAGIRLGDLLVGTNGQEFSTPDDVRQALADEQPGETMTFTVERQGREQEIQVRLGTRPRQEQRPGAPEFGPDMDRMMREFRGFGPDRQLIQEHRQIQREHERLKEQVGELREQLQQLRQELNQLRQREGGAGQDSRQND